MTSSWALLMTLLLLPLPLAAGSAPWPMPEWPQGTPREMGMDEAKLRAARDYALKGGGSGIIVRKGRAVLRWGDQKRRYDLKSTTKSFGATALAIALKDGKIESLEDKAKHYHPTFGVAKDGTGRREWLDAITIFHLATQTAGFAKRGGTGKLLFAPGTKWAYSDSGPNWLAECITLVYRRDVRDLMFERVFTPLGIQASDLSWRSNSYRPHKIDGIPRREFGSGISASVDAMARVGYLYLRRGRWQKQQILPEWFIDAARTTPRPLDGLTVVGEKTYSTASSHYGLLWWNNADGTLAAVPRDSYWSWGLYDSLIVVIPSLDIVVARAGRSFRGSWSGHYDKLVPFLCPIAQSVKSAGTTGKTPYPPSPVIKGIEWAPADTIVRLARGGDNWPCTWGDDGHLYTAYGDGNGFKPKVRGKLSLGLARVEGSPPDIKGINIRSGSAEQKGGGASGKKASGMLMVDGTLHMWVRNAKNSQLAWSRDRGKTWTWADWRFTTSFGYPTFLNFGRNYAGARDGYVYVYSHDHASAYRPADRMVLARVAKGRIAERDAYEFFVRLDADGKPAWTRDIAQRGAVFTHRRRCYRSGISYDAGLERYLWCQIVPGGDTRFKGGFGIYDAPGPWGPWTTVFFTERWDVGPGETSSFPTKWMSGDGRTLHLVFSGNDCFSVRKATLLARSQAGGGKRPLPGQIVADPEHPQWLRRAGGGPFFMCGPGDPEGFLYRGKRRHDGTRDGDQMALIRKLAGTGANCIYLMAIRSHGGDGDRTHNPFVDNDPAKGINAKLLDQWETWFDAMDRAGIVIYFFVYDDSTRVWRTGDRVGEAERRFIRALVDRFEHHKHLIWCVAEEYQERFSAAAVRAIAAEIRAADDHAHPIAVHKLGGLKFDELADDPNIHQFAIQYNVPGADKLHRGMVEAWRRAAGRYGLNMSECAHHGSGAEARRRSWACAMGGACVMILGMDIAATPLSDLQDCGRLVRFFESTNFHEMAPHDELRHAGTDYVLALPGHSYIAYAANLEGRIGLKGMKAGTYRFQWFDCATGKSVTQRGVAVAAGNLAWPEPAAVGDELAVHIRRDDE